MSSLKKSPDLGARVDRLAELAQHGYRRTTQRAVILEILERAGGHLTAEEVAKQVEERGVPLNRSTVYRTLETLAEIGVLRGTRMGRAVHYEIAAEDDEHHHVRCVRCHKMVHLEARQVDRLLRKLAADEEFEVIDVQLLVAGLCAGCRRADRR